MKHLSASARSFFAGSVALLSAAAVFNATKLAVHDSGSERATGREKVARRGDTPDPGAMVRSLSTPIVENRGQWNAPALFRATRSGQVVSFERDAIALRFVGASNAEGVSGVVVRLEIESMDDASVVRGAGCLPGVRNYFLGDDPSAWRTDVPAWSEVVYHQVRRGVDVHVHDGSAGTACDLEYDVVLAPHADLDSLAFRCRGVAALSLRADGSLALETPLGDVIQSAPVTWQERPDGTRVPVACRIRLLGPDRFGFEVDGRDDGLPLCIDPGLDWSTFIGGGQDDALRSVFVDPSGFIDVAGTSSSSDFPMSAGTFDSSFNGATDAVVARFDPGQTGGAQLLWATYLGGSGD